MITGVLGPLWLKGPLWLQVLGSVVIKGVLGPLWLQVFCIRCDYRCFGYLILLKVLNQEIHVWTRSITSYKMFIWHTFETHDRQHSGCDQSQGERLINNTRCIFCMVSCSTIGQFIILKCDISSRTLMKCYSGPKFTNLLSTSLETRVCSKHLK